VNKYVEQLRGWWSALEAGQRRQLGAALALAVLALVAVGVWSSTTSYKAILSNRSYDDLLAAAASLDAAEVPYRISDRGTLDVPVDKIGAARAALGGATLPSLNDVGDLKLGLTPRAQEWAFLRAREGDIARMLGSIDGVAAAQVNIVPRQEALFSGDDTPASASVFLRTRPGATISDGQVRAMVSLVGNAVEGLDSERVSVTDDHGNLLARGEGRASGDAPSEILEYRGKLERDYERAASQALLPVLGSGAEFAVTATVDLDLTSSQTTSKSYDTEKPAVLSEQMDESASQRSSANATAAGVDANLPERPAASGGKDSNNERTASTMNYVYPTKDEVQHRPAGGIRRVNVAVQVNSARVLALVANDAPAAEALQKQIAEAVRTAVGQDEARGDNVAVNFLPFAAPQWVEAEPQGLVLGPETLQQTLPYALAALALALSFAFVVRPLIANVTEQNKLKREDEIRTEREARAAEEESEDEDLAERLHQLVTNFEHVDASDLNRLVEQNAGAAVEVIRRWRANG